MDKTYNNVFFQQFSTKKLA